MASWYNASWSHRLKIIVNSEQVEADITDYDLLITDANMPQVFFDNAESDGADIVFTASDGTTKLDRDLIKIDTTNNLFQARVKTDVDSDADTVIYLYFGNSSASETAHDATVYPSNLEAYLPLEEDPGTASPTDYTDNYTPGKAGTWTNGDLLDGHLCNAWDFDSAQSDSINLPDAAGLDMPDAFTISLMLNFDSLPGTSNYYIIDRASFAANKRSYWLYFSDSTNEWITNVDADGTSGSTCVYEFLDSVDAGIWYHLVWKYNKADASPNRSRLWINGLQLNPTTITDVANSPFATDIPLYFGGEVVGGSSYFDGKLDEIRVYRAGLSAEDIKTRARNEYNPWSFYSVEEPVLSSVALNISKINGISITL